MLLNVTKNYSAPIPYGVQVVGGNYAGDCPPEDADLISLVSWVKYNHPELAKLMYHIPNESMMPVQGRVMANKKGVISGAPDLCFATVPAVYIELKRRCVKKSLSSSKARQHFEQQLAVLSNLQQAGNQCFVCFGLDNAKKVVSMLANGSRFATM